MAARAAAMGMYRHQSAARAQAVLVAEVTAVAAGPIDHWLVAAAAEPIVRRQQVLALAVAGSDGQ